jgi:hypothetical protein
LADCLTKSALGNQIPKLYHGLVAPELLSFEIIETKATCSNCAMSRANRGPRATITYEAHLKCCTFDPWVPNFMVGAILQDSATSKAGRQAVLEKISSIEECSPLGLRPSTKFQRRFLRKSENEFGNREDWLCPYFDRQNQNCGIWAHRGNVCTSFFCKSDAGTRGLNFWSELGDYLHLIELSVMEECLVQLDFSPRQLSDLLPLIDRQTHLQKKVWPPITPREAKAFWNQYDDPVAFFKKCHKVASQIGPRELNDILGEIGARSYVRLQARMQALPKL